MDHVGTLGRGGVVVAMSGGLVATMGLPAHAVGRNSAAPEAAPATAPIAVQPALAFQSGLLAAPAGAQAGAAPLSAPAAATVEFESSAFTAVPKKVAPPVRATATGRSTGSRSGLSSEITTSAFGSARGSSVLAVAARYIGVPYLYGGTTPRAWDCSGATSYIFAQIGVKLPRTANEQMLATKRVSSSAAQAGDLVFFISGGRAYHVGIYAGNGMMYDAQRTGKAFTKRAVYSSAVVYGRV